MKYSLKATSIIESLVVLLIVVTGVVGVYKLMDSSQKLSRSTADRIEAIQIARDGLEAFTNIRETNWLLFTADYPNCWNNLNYDYSCIGNTRHSGQSNSSDIAPGNYRIFKNTDGQFELSSSIESGGFSDSDYRDDFEVFTDSNGFYTQVTGTQKRPVFTRRMQVEYLNADDSPGNSNGPKMRVTAVVEWSNSAKAAPEKLEMDVLLTNWKVDL